VSLFTATSNTNERNSFPEFKIKEIFCFSF